MCVCCVRECNHSVLVRSRVRSHVRVPLYGRVCVGGPLFLWRTSVVILFVWLFACFLVRSFACACLFVCVFVRLPLCVCVFVCLFLNFFLLIYLFVCLFDRLLACRLQRMSETLVRLAVRIVQQVPGQCHGTQSTHRARQSSGLVALCFGLRLPRSGR